MCARQSNVRRRDMQLIDILRRRTALALRVQADDVIAALAHTHRRLVVN